MLKQYLVELQKWENVVSQSMTQRFKQHAARTRVAMLDNHQRHHCHHNHNHHHHHITIAIAITIIIVIAIISITVAASAEALQSHCVEISGLRTCLRTGLQTGQQTGLRRPVCRPVCRSVCGPVCRPILKQVCFAIAKLQLWQHSVIQTYFSIGLVKWISKVKFWRTGFIKV